MNRRIEYTMKMNGIIKYKTSKQNNDGVFYLRITEYNSTKTTVYGYREHVFKNKKKCLDFLNADVQDVIDNKNVVKKTERFYADIFKYIEVLLSNGEIITWVVTQLFFED